MNEPGTRTTDVNRAVWRGVAVVLVGSMLWLLYASRGHARGPTRPVREQVVLNEVAKAFVMYAFYKGERKFYPDHVSRLVPQYLDPHIPELEDGFSSSLEPWPDEDVYAYGSFYFVRHVSARYYFDDGRNDDGFAATNLILAFGEANRRGERNAVFLDGHCEMMEERHFVRAMTRTLKSISRSHEQAVDAE